MASIQVSSIAALKTALANNVYDDIIVTNGIYVVAGASQQATTSLWIGAAFAGRTTPVTVRAETPGGVTFSGGGATSWIGIAFEEGAHDQTWDGFNFGNGTPSGTGVVFIGGYNSAPPHHITLRRFTMLSSIGDSGAGSNDNLIYFSHSQAPGPHHITIEDYDADMSGGVDSAITFFHNEGGLENAEDITVRRANIRNHSGDGSAIQIWATTAARILFEDVTITNTALGIQFEYGTAVTLRRVQTINTSGPGYYSGTGKAPVYDGCAYVSGEIVLTVPPPATTKYVATTGNDTTGTGAIGSPWATLAKALNTANVGDTIEMRGGTYANTFKNGRDTVIIQNYPGEHVTIQRTTAGGVLQLENSRNITIRKNPSGGSLTVRSTVAGNGSSSGIFVYRDASQPGFVPSNILIDGVVVNNIAGYGIQIVDTSAAVVQNVDVSFCGTGIRFRRVTGASFIQDGASHNIDRMIVSDATASNDNGGTGISLDASVGVTVQRMQLYENHAVSVDYGVDGGAVEFFECSSCIVQDCTAYNNNGFIETGTGNATTHPMPDNLIRRNLVYGKLSYHVSNPGNFVIVRAGTNLRIYNNTVDVDDGDACIYVQGAVTGYSAPIHNLKVKNNIFVVRSSTVVPYKIYNITSMTGIEIDYNLLYKSTGSGSTFVDANNYGPAQNGTGLVTWRANSPFSDHDIWNVDPLFVNRTARNYNLSPTSQAVNAGVVISGTTDGYLGSAPDMGKYESSSVGATGTVTLTKGFSTTAAGTLTVATTGTVTLTKGWSTAAAGSQGLGAITGTSASAFRAGVTASGKLGVAGAAASSFTFSTASVGKPNGIVGTVTLSKGFSTAVTGAQTIGGGVAASTFRFASAAVGVERITGTAAPAFAFSSVSAGNSTQAAVAASAFSFSTTAAGTERMQGTSASAFRFSTAGVGTEGITGTSAAAFGWQASRNEGPAASAFSFATQAIGTGVLPSASTFTWTTSAAGKQTMAGTSASAFTFATAGVSSQGVNGTSSSAFRFSTDAAGVEQLQPGSAVSEFVWSSAAVGEMLLNAGTSESAFGFSTEAEGLHDTPGAAASEFGWSTEAIAEALDPQAGVADSSFGWSTEATGAHTAPPQQAASEFGWSTSAVGSVLAGVAASAFTWTTGAGGTTGVVDPVPPPKPGRGRGHKHWPWLPPDQA